MSGPSRILVIRWGRLGDLFLTAAATRDLKHSYPDARIVLATKEEYREAAELLPGVDELALFTGGGVGALVSFQREKLNRRFELVVDLHGNIRSRLLTRLVRAGKRVCVRRDVLGRRLLVRWKRGKGREVRPVWKRYLDTAERGGASVRPDPPRLLDRGGEGIRGALAFAPGAGRFTKRWPAERFAAAARAAAVTTGRPLLFVGSSLEKELLIEVQRLAGGDGKVLAGLPLAETAAHLRDAALLVTNDSGLMHLACGVGRPVIALFGPTTVEFGFEPAGEGSVVLSRDLPCRPCSLHGTERCPVRERDHDCMTLIPVEEVVEQIGMILRDSGEEVR